MRTRVTPSCSGPWVTETTRPIMHDRPTILNPWMTRMKSDGATRRAGAPDTPSSLAGSSRLPSVAELLRRTGCNDGSARRANPTSCSTARNGLSRRGPASAEVRALPSRPCALCVVLWLTMLFTRNSTAATLFELQPGSVVTLSGGSYFESPLVREVVFPDIQIYDAARTGWLGNMSFSAVAVPEPPEMAPFTGALVAACLRRGRSRTAGGKGGSLTTIQQA